MKPPSYHNKIKSRRATQL
ncbi:hypothetical protein CISIN_1g0260402mg, partial [Citrus sinensis]